VFVNDGNRRDGGTARFGEDVYVSETPAARRLQSRMAIVSSAAGALASVAPEVSERGGARPPATSRTRRQLSVAVVAPTLEILGGQAVQADRLLRAWSGDPDVDAWLVPVNPRAPGMLAAAQRVRYVRTGVTQALYWPSLARRLRFADVVHVFSAAYTSFLLAPWPAVRVARLLGKPVLLNYRSGEAPDHLARSPLARRTLRGADLNVVPSRFLRDVFARFAIDATVIPNVVETDRFAFRQRSRIGPRLISTRNLEPLYNVACTLRAFRLVQDRYPDATLTLVGAGSDERQLRRLAGDLRLEGVAFAGRIQQHDIARCYAEADIYVQTPDVDNMPSSILEAWSSGLPVVSTEAGGVPAIVTSGSDGLLAPLDDHRAVAAAVTRLIDDSRLAATLVENGRRNADALGWDRLRGLWLAAYRSLAAHSEPSLAAAR
jgi:glycosyltransferase involved in cell wall biosynthesis